jgi:hypothetical protein
MIIIDIYGYINFKSYITMGCGCKNQGNQTPPPAQQTNTPAGQSQPQTQPIQESIRKVVERYYTKK